MTPENERRLFREITTIKRSIGALFVIGVGIVAAVASHYVADKLERAWGGDSLWLWIIPPAVFIAVWLCLLSFFRRA